MIGNASHAQMPGFAGDLGHGDPGVSYTVLLAADAAGALLAGIALEAWGRLKPTPRLRPHRETEGGRIKPGTAIPEIASKRILGFDGHAQAPASQRLLLLYDVACGVRPASFSANLTPR